MKEEFDNEETFLNRDLFEFPKELRKTCTEGEFHKMMTSHNSDIPIDKVEFVDYPD